MDTKRDDLKRRIDKFIDNDEKDKRYTIPGKDDDIKKQTVTQKEKKTAGKAAGGEAVKSSRPKGSGKKFIAIGIIAAVVILALIIGGSASAKAKAKAEAAAAEAQIIREANIDEARVMAAQYDYDGAIAFLQTLPEYENDAELQAIASEFEATKGTLIEQDITKITHVFFHILCVDTSNAFDSARWGTQAGGYNALMTTVYEFKLMLRALYDKGYVLVSMNDMIQEEQQPDGTVKVVPGKIMLPPGKQAIVISEDDVCYYEYMTGAGFADKMVIGEDGRPTTHYTDKDGNQSVGDYDIVPILDHFIDEHPDFSYKGHKACLVFTGYNGVLGYRTDETYRPDSPLYDPSLEQGHDVDAERAEAVKVLKALADDGYDLGSHSWGHRDMGQITLTHFQTDTDRWERNVASLITEATGKHPNILIFPKGADISDWRGYTFENERFAYLYNLGFRIFCNVDSSRYWVQLGDNYLRQGRRALDGFCMWRDIAGGKNYLGDLFDDVSAVFDPSRPTPVPSY